MLRNETVVGVKAESEETFFLFIIKIFALRDLFIIYLHLSSAAERVM